MLVFAVFLLEMTERSACKQQKHSTERDCLDQEKSDFFHKPAVGYKDKLLFFAGQDAGLCVLLFLHILNKFAYD